MTEPVSTVSPLLHCSRTRSFRVAGHPGDRGECLSVEGIPVHSAVEGIPVLSGDFCSDFAGIAVQSQGWLRYTAWLKGAQLCRAPGATLVKLPWCFGWVSLGCHVLSAARSELYMWACCCWALLQFKPSPGPDLWLMQRAMQKKVRL